MSQLNPDQPVFNAKYFHRKFRAIPEELFTVCTLGKPGEPRCALGHCLDGENSTPESTGLISIVKDMNLGGYNVAQVNNGFCPAFPQPTPKLRILSAMEKAKGMGL